MTAKHYVDREHRVIITTWDGHVSDQDLIAALSSYLQEYRCDSEYHNYDELLDFSHAAEINLTTKGIIELSKLSHQSDVEGVQTRLAIIATSPLTFGLARMYVAYRNLLSSSKIMKVVKTKDDAFTWLRTPVES
ncbi:hypothetical protein Ga0123462_1543 [Mariprofundus ferrinatatus]|uniref:SpoIIAA-like n=1 Tax=Mariprofundus ferrinatatus TaxID=1921087 RepID=A0A2K8LDP7_9PROT|nr:STAS/SEC14 domain-containing protein [Mariprofundus ferrinatatus]ATX82406.1 hypothetical protein Ga0123462_1543 [Mariprofundus ferrinatatus]